MSAELQALMSKKRQQGGASTYQQQNMRGAQQEYEVLQQPTSPSPEVQISSTQKLGAAADLAGRMSGNSPGGSVVSGALSGAATGAAFGGPVGAGIGATVGVVGALAQNSSNRKAQKREIEANKWREIGKIQESSGTQQAQILQNMVAGLRGSFV